VYYYDIEGLKSVIMLMARMHIGTLIKWI